MPDKDKLPFTGDLRRMLESVRSFGEGARFTKEQLKEEYLNRLFEEWFQKLMGLDFMREDPNNKGKYFLKDSYWDDLMQRIED